MHSLIKKDKQIKKFCYYGFFKNLRFFEPYLLIYLLTLGYSLFTIGLLFAFREIIVYLFEIPSGMIADHYGKKKELLLCFIFYIISFISFYLSSKGSIMIAMLFFGLGEAFRSGTHKAMIISYLEQKKWNTEKTFVYGRTRSYSLLGSAISSLLSIIFIINFENLRGIFLIAIIPYFLDFLLILSYPPSLDEGSGEKLTLKEFKNLGVGHIKSLKNNKELKKIMLSSAFYDSIFKSIKDYIQPIILVLIVSKGMMQFNSFTDDMTKKVILGVMYFIFYMFSSQVSKNVYRITRIFSASNLFNALFLYSSVVSGLLMIFILKDNILGISICFLLFYVMKDGRRPLFVELSSHFMNKNERATMLSIESQFKALLTIILGPLFGFIADSYKIENLFILISIMYFILYVVFKNKNEEEL